MKYKKIDHIGIVVNDIESACEHYHKILNLEFVKKEYNEEFQCSMGFFKCGEVLIELVQPIGPSMAKTWLDEKGEGIYHVCYEVDDIEKAFSEAKEKGLTDYEKPLQGACNSKVFFLKPELVNSVETEIVQQF